MWGLTALLELDWRKTLGKVISYQLRNTTNIKFKEILQDLLRFNTINKSQTDDTGTGTHVSQTSKHCRVSEDPC